MSSSRAKGLMVHTGAILPIYDFYITLRFIACSTYFNIFISEYQTAVWVNCHPHTHTQAHVHPHTFMYTLTTLQHYRIWCVAEYCNMSLCAAIQEKLRNMLHVTIITESKTESSTININEMYANL